MPRTSQGKYVTRSASVFQEGDEAWKNGLYNQAKEKYIESAKLYHDDKDEEGEAFALVRLGELQLSLDEYEDAEKSLKAASELVKHLDFAQNTYGEALIRLARVEIARDENDRALRYLNQAKEVLEQIGNRDLLGDACDQEAYVYLNKCQPEKALASYRKAAEYYHMEGVTLKEASVLRAIARLEMKNKNYDLAHDLLEECRNLYRENGDLLGEASALSAIGCLRYIIRDIGNARKALMKSVYLYGKAVHHYAEAEALLYLARVEAFNQEQGDFERAKTHYRRSAELFSFLENDTMKHAVEEEYHNFLNRINAA